MVADVQAPGYETRIAILKAKARLYSIEMPDDVASLLAERLDSNVRLLEGAVKRLHLASRTDQKPVDLAMALDFLGEQPDVPQAPAFTVQDVIELVSELFSIKPCELLGRNKSKSIVLPRHVCMYLARRLERYSLEEIGVYMGGRDHTTVLNGWKSIDKRRAEDDGLDRLLAGLEKQLSIRL